MWELRDKSATIFVSHSMLQIAKVCTSGFLMSEGRSVGGKAPVAESIQSYLDQFDGPALSKAGAGAVDIEGITLQQGSHDRQTLYPIENGKARIQDFNPSTDITLELQYRKKKPIGKIVVQWSIFDMELKLVAQALSNPLDPDPAAPFVRIVTRLGPLQLNSGRYSLTVSLYASNYPAWNAVLAGLRDFAELSVKIEHFVGAAPVIYANETSVASAG
jgi:hypothetical protein